MAGWCFVETKAQKTQNCCLIRRKVIMKTKWLAGIVGMVLLLGMMVSCSDGGDSPLGSITVTNTKNVAADAVSSIKVGNTTAVLDIPVPVAVEVVGQVTEVTIEIKDTGADVASTLTGTVVVKEGEAVTVTVQKLTGGGYLLDVPKTNRPK
jgi:hypothetical protein